MTPPRLVIDWPDRRLWVDGAPHRLTPQQWTVLNILVRARGRLVSFDILHSEVWPNPDHEPEGGTRSLQTVICKLRGRMRPSGARILAEYGAGYRLLLPDGVEVVPG